MLPTSSTAFPYATLFRSADGPADREPRHGAEGSAEEPALHTLDGCFRLVHTLCGRDDVGAGGHPLALHRSSPIRSEEHTSELQSLAYIVCRLLLEKKKKVFNIKMPILKNIKKKKIKKIFF